MSLEPPEFDAHDEAVATVEALVERRRYDQARSAAAAGLHAHPDSLPLMYLHAFVDWAQDRNTDAQATVARLLELAPEHYGGRVLQGHLATEAGRHAEAEQMWIGVLRDYPEDADAYGHYAGLMLTPQHLGKARRLAAEGLRFEPEHHHCLSVIAMCDLVENRPASAAARLEELVRAHPEHVRTALTMVVALQERGDARGALRVAQELLRAQPDNEDFVQMVRELKAATHWSMRPLYPMQRWGWKASFALWGLIALGLPVMSKVLPEPLALAILGLWLAYVVYSWVWPALIKRIV